MSTGRRATTSTRRGDVAASCVLALVLAAAPGAAGQQPARAGDYCGLDGRPLNAFDIARSRAELVDLLRSVRDPRHLFHDLVAALQAMDSDWRLDYLAGRRRALPPVQRWIWHGEGDARDLPLPRGVQEQVVELDRALVAEEQARAAARPRTPDPRAAATPPASGVEEAPLREIPTGELERSHWTTAEQEPELERLPKRSRSAPAAGGGTRSRFYQVRDPLHNRRQGELAWATMVLEGGYRRVVNRARGLAPDDDAPLPAPPIVDERGFTHSRYAVDRPRPSAEEIERLLEERALEIFRRYDRPLPASYRTRER